MPTDDPNGMTYRITHLKLATWAWIRSAMSGVHMSLCLVFLLQARQSLALSNMRITPFLTFVQILTKPIEDEEDFQSCLN